MPTTPISWGRRALLLALPALCVACAPTEAPPTVTPRPVKIEVVAAQAAEASARYIGSVRAQQRSDLGFETGGRIAALKVDIGDRVRAGQVLALLDETPARERLSKAQADWSAAQAALSERRTQLRQQERLAQEQVISATALESAQTQYRVAETQLQAAEAALTLARRDLALSRIVAPFDGTIAARLVQAHTDVAGGQPVLQIEGGRALEVVVLLPQSVAAGLQPGAKAQLRGSADASDAPSVPVRLERLSERVENGSLVQAVFHPTQEAKLLRSGATVALDLPQSGVPGLSLPAEALLLGEQRGDASVFLLKDDKLASQRIRVEPMLAAGGRVKVLSGLQAGDRVVVAGAAFLTPGQAAIEHRATTALSGARR